MEPAALEYGAIQQRTLHPVLCFLQWWQPLVNRFQSEPDQQPAGEFCWGECARRGRHVEAANIRGYYGHQRGRGERHRHIANVEQLQPEPIPDATSILD